MIRCERCSYRDVKRRKEFSMVAEKEVWEALKQVIDPELGVNIVDLGLVYEVHCTPEGRVQVKMTMTTPAC
ncbi:metal-sulfur cluster assembly factor, partial [Ardenticatena maritima]|uniref:metal-sulfur cluster assembly factor n=1 Tax=Ardenticatena maritima TaxID=872965 RepID=UPI00350E5824